MAKKENIVINKGTSRFGGYGKVKDLTNAFTIDKINDKKTWKYSSLNLTVETAHGDIRIDLMGGRSTDPKKAKLYVHGKKADDNGKMVDDFKNSFTVMFQDRNNQAVLDKVGELCFLKARDKEGETHKFLSEVDMINFLKNNLSKNDIVYVGGSLEFNIFKNKQGEQKISVKKKLNNITILSDEKVEELEKEDKLNLEIGFTQQFLTFEDTLGKPSRETMTADLLFGFVERVNEYNDKEIIRMVNGEEKKGCLMPFTKTATLVIKDIEASKKVAKHLNAKKGHVGDVVCKGYFSTSTNVETTELDLSSLSQDLKDLLEAGLISEEQLQAKYRVATGGGMSRVEELMVTGVDTEIKILNDGSVEISIKADREKYGEDNFTPEALMEVQNARFKEDEIEEPNLDGDNPFGDDDDEEEFEWGFDD